jgi:propanol-preferring alcohol dehydrogenase
MNSDKSVTNQVMLLKQQRESLSPESLALRNLQGHEILIQVSACAICRTDLHVIDGDLEHPALPVVPGHEIVGRVAAIGKDVTTFHKGDRVACAWLASACQQCRFCLGEHENLCENARFTGYTTDGGFARFTIADSAFAYKLSEQFSSVSDEEIAPLMCAGLIGWRSFKMAARGQYKANGRKLGIYGFGAAGHLILQVANYFGWQTYAFTRDADKGGQEFALQIGAAWAGGSSDSPPEKMDAAIIFAPVGSLVPAALKGLEKGGIVVCGGIHMSKIPEFDYDLLWQERTLSSVANLTRKDAIEFLELAPTIGIKAKVTRYRLSDVNKAIEDLREGRLNGAAVLIMGKWQWKLQER